MYILFYQGDTKIYSNKRKKTTEEVKERDREREREICDTKRYKREKHQRTEEK